MEIDDSGYSDIQTCQITTNPSVTEPVLRKSIRIKEKIAAKTLEHSFDCAAKIPDFQDETEAADDSDRDERVSTPEDFKLLLKRKSGDKNVLNSSSLLTKEILEKCKIHQYFSACGTKFNGDTDSALLHLSANGYSIKKSLESIDNPDSIPMKRIQENLGIWREKERDAFVEFMSNNYKPKKECLNCVKQLWESQSEEQVSNLCGLCKLYFELYGKQRPNAKALPLHFNLSPKKI
uniref:ELM2 domain-containing protein n=1 Tax=Panagrolaimus davidi TaxID=227884 RepID=A0A914R7H0_9BILA